MAVAQPKIESPSRNALLPVVAASLLMIGCSGNESAGPAISTTVDWGPRVPRPIPIAKDAPTHQQYVDKERRWLTRLMLDTYEKQGTHGVAWDSKTEKAFASYCEAMASPSDRAGIESAVASCRAAREAGCRDPLLDYCLGSMLMAQGTAEEVEALLTGSWKAMEANAYPRYLAFLCARKLGQWMRAKKGTPASVPWFEAAASQLGRAIREPCFDDGNQRIFVRGLFGTWGHSSILEPAEAILKETHGIDDLDPWICQILAGYALVDSGFKVRGSKWASEVPEGARQKMSSLLGQAGEVLEAAHRAHPEYPEAAAKMITVRMAISTGDPSEDLGRLRKWFDAAVAAEMDYKPAYDQMLWALRPRWGGSHEHMLSFGRECLETARFDTGVPILFWEAIRGVASETKDLSAILRRDGVTKLFDRLVEGISGEETWKNLMPFWRSLQILVHYAAGERDRATALFAKYGGSFDEKAFEQAPGLERETVLKDLRSSVK